MMALLLAKIPEEVLLVVAIPLVGGILIALTSILTGHYRKLVRDDMAATLKMEMIQRGMSGDEIERVLEARMATFSEHGSRGFGRQRRQHESSHS
jgi:hypothetical protein